MQCIVHNSHVSIISFRCYFEIAGYLDWRLTTLTKHMRELEWPTIGLAVVIYGMWLSLTWFHAAIPWPLLFIAGGWVVAWQGSLQHELIHGHPTSWPAINRALGLPSLVLFLPFDRYRALHLAHHRNDHLTDPLEDPETYYWTASGWSDLHKVTQVVVGFMARLCGRLILGPAWMIGRFLYRDAGRVLRDEPGVRRAWRWHVAMLSLIMLWVITICGIDPLAYLACFVLPGTCLLLIRSFAEHRAAIEADHRTAVVENSHIFGLLFLFNNLHSAHHERPSLAWYRLPGWYRQERERLLLRNGGLVYRGYGDVIRRFLFWPHDHPVHPFDSGNGRAVRG